MLEAKPTIESAVLNRGEMSNVNLNELLMLIKSAVSIL